MARNLISKLEKVSMRIHLQHRSPDGNAGMPPGQCLPFSYSYSQDKGSANWADSLEPAALRLNLALPLTSGGELKQFS